MDLSPYFKNVLYFTFRSLIYFDLSFCLGCEIHVQVYLFCFVPSAFVEKTIFHIIKLPLCLCQKSVDYNCVVCYWSLYSVSLIYMPIFHQYHTILIKVSLQTVLKLGNMSPPIMFFFRVGWSSAIKILESTCQCQQKKVLLGV